MASTGPKLGGYSQFYINLVNNPSLNGDYAVFGKIISSNGLSIANKIAALPEDTACGNSGAGAPPADPSEAMLISVEIVNQTSTSSST